ncbi:MULTISPECIES: CRISPR-associated endonuclease Cas2 [unclassified Corynebacterium]|uniref:CRISPR-associated endonuclease Cas2 n=1 Tax=unclassified Corynebacterium TaxID=2624378 RepID=UPI0008A26A77|nr:MULTISPECIES: CRISPR-associated endonuclease Cas2 [unclassified Corynebacterium]MCQ4610548.1 CRISPR-associated endonuclease Cas2 [Corynebacterium sp. CCUG 61414]MCQ4613110.1 CRISPR-associated endonuclease Cas2 [Corynebacterium sp. CCUG 51687]MDK8364926.1 CRISPR-associated endonuclease Cas2 [Corynebacterium sp. UMB10119B]OFT29490.1 CRISPR-associated endonuclease Cas2 [Corynebacterium sp. HMSC08D02]
MSRDDARRTLICYDIIHDRRRDRVATTLQEYGDRVQYSVFIVDISPARLLQLKSELEQLIDSDEDSILFCDLGRVAELNEQRFGYLGKSREVTDNDVLIL